MSLKIAALLTSRSMPPNCETAAPASAWVEACEETSTSAKAACPPAARISEATFSPRCLSISATTTFAPASPSAFAYASPMPPPEPVTIATLPEIPGNMLRSLSVRSAAVAHQEGLLRAHHHRRVVVHVASRRRDELELEAPQQHREDGLLLHQGEVGTEAAMPPAAEGHIGERVLRVLLARRREAVGIEALRLREAGGVEVRERGRHRDDRALRHRHAVVLEIDERRARQPDERRVQAQRLLH